MESLLSLSFDYLSCSDASKIRKGLKQLEGLLAQLCLCRSSHPTAADRRRSMISTGSTVQAPKDLGALKDDPAFREYFKLQEGFECNVAIRLIACLERLLGRGSNGQNDLLIISTLDLLQGILLVHPASRSLFAREIYMNLLLDLLDTSNCPAIQSSALLTLVVALLEQPHNTRTFETLDGLLTVTSLFKSRSTGRELRLKLVEFLYFYLMPETPYVHSASVPTTAVSGPPSPSKRSGTHSQSVSSAGAGDGFEVAGTKPTEEKQALLGRYLNNVEDLVEDLRGNAPFGPALE